MSHLDTMTADEAHKPHETDLLHYLYGMYADSFATAQLMPKPVYNALHDLGWMSGFELTPAGLAQIAGKAA